MGWPVCLHLPTWLLSPFSGWTVYLQTQTNGKSPVILQKQSASSLCLVEQEKTDLGLKLAGCSGFLVQSLSLSLH